MELRLFFLAAPMIALIGCTSTTPLSQTPKEPNTVLNVIDEFKNKSQKGFSLYDLYDPSGVNPGFTKWGKGYSAYQRWWCAKDQNRVSHLTSLIEQHCESKLGTYSNGWCHAENSALFRVKIGLADLVEERTATPFCKTGHEIGVLAVTGEDATDMSTWRNWIVSELAYRTPSQEKRRLKVANREALKKAEAELLEKDLNASAILASGVGSKICRMQADITYVGFVEAVENGRVKILLSDAFYKTSRNIRPSGFEQKMIWDVPKNWILCL